ncbi:MAG TPA: MG2 domain-containing protein [Phycisphaerae bacterium]|nr:MG2 domain-containing protein [Phycisphaerae bacterium]
MSCETVRERFYEHLFGLLDGEERVAVEAHLEACPECRKALEQAVREKDLLGAWKIESAPAGLAEATAAALQSLMPHGEAEPAVPPAPVEPDLKWLGSRGFWKGATALAATVLVGLALHSLWISLRRAEPQETYVYGQAALEPGQPAAYRVFVRNGKTGESVEGARVRVALVSAEDTAVWTTRLVTDSFGFARIETAMPPNVPEGNYTLRVVAESEAGTSEVAEPVAVKRSFRLLVTTDKPLYQPGQVIHLRTLALATADLTPVADRDVTLEILDPNGNKVFKKSLRTSRFGIASADFELADQVNTGDYAIRATIGETASERSVRVEPYVLPKFRIDLKTERGYYLPGEILRGDLAAEYTFGKPVAGAAVRVVASEFIEKFRPFATVEGRTDEEGRFRFEVPLKDAFVGLGRTKGDASVTLEATVTDSAGHTQTQALELAVTIQPLRVEVFPESGRLVQGVENVLYLVTAYPDGRPAKTRLTIGATREVVETSDAGIAKVRITPAQEDLRLTIRAEDARGTQVTVAEVLPIGARTETILLRTDRAIYRAGDSAEITVLSADRTGRVFLDVVKDRRTVLMKALDVEDGAADLVFDLPPDLFGTLELHAYCILPDGNIVGDTRLIQVNRPEDLKIRATLDKSVYRPAEKAILEFLVTRANGDPAQAALSLAAVDEAVFALSEMRPGLERIYFMLQEEILKPRYEIHACTPADVIAPELKPELQEATVVLFSAAEGAAPPEQRASETFEAKQERFEREEGEHYDRVAAGALLVPFGLFVAFTMPVLLYALAKLFRRKPITGSARQAAQLRWAAHGVLVWWILGYLLPPIWGLFVVILGIMLRLFHSPASTYGAVALAFGLAVALAAYKMSAWAKEFRAVPASRSVPLLRKIITAMPAAYLFAALSALTVLVAIEERLIREEAAFWLLGAAWLLVVGAGGALSVGQHCATERVSLLRWFWLAGSRGALAALPGLFFVILLLPAGFSALEQANRVPFEFDREATAAVESPEPESPVRVRRHFPETLLWQPELITDELGRAQIEIPLADSITTWRVAASAVSARGELGAQNFPLRVFQDFFVDIDFPTALTQGDVVSVPVALYNYLDRPQAVRLEVQKGDWFELLDEPTRTLQIGAEEITSASFRVKATKPGRHALTVKAFGSEMADAVEREVAVRPDGEEFVQTLNGRLAKGLIHEITIPDEAIDGASDLFVKIYPGAFSQVLEGLDSIFRMPFGCFEQTSSVTYPNILVLDYMRRTRQIKPDVEMKALQFINLGYQRLLSFEVRGGGFEWFGNAPAHLVLTAYGLMEFADMARVYDIDPAVIERTREWLYGRQQADGSWQADGGGLHEMGGRYDRTLQTTAYVTWALAESGPDDRRLARACDFLAQGASQESDPYTLALCANALLAAGRPEAKAILQRLSDMQIADDKQVHWTSAAEGATFSRGEALEVETTALAAYALLKAGSHTDTAHKALAWLIEHKDPYGTWHSTQATVHAMRALLLGTGAGGSVEGETTITVAANDQAAEKILVTPETSDVFRLVSLRPFVRPGRNTVRLDAVGEGDLAYQIVARYYLPWPGKAAPPAEKEMTIDVAYDATTLKADDTLVCTATICYNRPGSAKMTIVDLGIPPGFEVLGASFEAMKAEGLIQRYAMTGRQVILYFAEIPGMKPIRFTYRLRAKFPVKVKTPPSVIYQYYEPELRDETRPVELTVL